jgi:hypothetical protein
MRTDSRFFVDVFNIKTLQTTRINFVEVICELTGKPVMPPLYIPNVSDDPKTLYISVLDKMRDHITMTLFEEV